MRSIQTTVVNVQVNDQLDRTNVVVVALRENLRRVCLFLREASKSLSKHCQRWYAAPAMCAAAAGSPSWGGHRSSGGPGTAWIS